MGFQITVKAQKGLRIYIWGLLSGKARSRVARPQTPAYKQPLVHGPAKRRRPRVVRRLCAAKPTSTSLPPVKEDVRAEGQSRGPARSLIKHRAQAKANGIRANSKMRQ